jgi:hypothetical protein
MVEVNPEPTSSGIHWFRTALAALLAFVTLGYALTIVVASGYSAAFDKPASPLGVLLCLALAAVPFIVGTYTYRRGHRRGTSRDALVRRVSLILFAIGIAELVALVLVAGPT